VSKSTLTNLLAGAMHAEAANYRSVPLIRCVSTVDLRVVSIMYCHSIQSNWITLSVHSWCFCPKSSTLIFFAFDLSKSATAAYLIFQLSIVLILFRWLNYQITNKQCPMHSSGPKIQILIGMFVSNLLRSSRPS
jgi:hypothetical protein